MTLYTAMILILISFFIILVGRANFDETRYAAALESIQQRFGIFTGGHLVSGTEDGLVDQTLGNDEEGHLVLPELEMAQIRSVLAPAIMEREARIIRAKGRRIISLSAGLVFKPDSWELTPETEETLSAFSKIVAEGTLPIRVEGHTDNHPPLTRGIGDNWDISMHRALAVTEFLANTGGLDAQRLSAFAYAGAKPLYSNLNPDGRAANNRVDLALDFSGLNADELKELAEEATSYNFKGFDFLLSDGEAAE